MFVCITLPVYTKYIFLPNQIKCFLFLSLSLSHSILIFTNTLPSQKSNQSPSSHSFSRYLKLKQKQTKSTNNRTKPNKINIFSTTDLFRFRKSMLIFACSFEMLSISLSFYLFLLHLTVRFAKQKSPH